MEIDQPRRKGRFEVRSNYDPVGDQITAIEEICARIGEGMKWQTLLGVTGSGKTFTMAKVIERLQRPTIVVTHNKTLAAQLYTEFKEFFPGSRVGYFVSYYDYYQPEAYVESRDLYIEKDSAINEKIDRLRHVATYSLFDRRDVIIVASVSCIYGLGDPSEYVAMRLFLEKGMSMDRDRLISGLIDILYERNDIDFTHRRFRVRGDVVEFFPPYLDNSIRVEFFGDEIETIRTIEPITGRVMEDLPFVTVFPANHYVVPEATRKRASAAIRAEMEAQIEAFKSHGCLVEAQRIRDRTLYDIEMVLEMGYCKGIENYSRHLDGRVAGSPPMTLLDYFSPDYLLMVDESHASLPQFRGMVNGDRSRKEALVKHGFRLPSAFDNRPLTFDEFFGKINQALFVSATPGDLELEKSGKAVSQLVTRPTGLLDPPITVKPATGQVDDLIGELNRVIESDGRALVTTLTKRMAEELTDYLKDLGIAAEYLHSDIDTVDRVKLLRRLREGEIPVIVGINLLREGLDLPEVKLVAILDADKEGFLRSPRSLIQTCGRAARNVDGRVIMYGDTVSAAMRVAIEETERRREIQGRFNLEHGIIPRSVVRAMNDGLVMELGDEADAAFAPGLGTKGKRGAAMPAMERRFLIEELTAQMRLAAENLEFERAAELRNRIRTLAGKEE